MTYVLLMCGNRIDKEGRIIWVDLKFRSTRIISSWNYKIELQQLCNILYVYYIYKRLNVCTCHFIKHSLYIVTMQCVCVCVCMCCLFKSWAHFTTVPRVYCHIGSWYISSDSCCCDAAILLFTLCTYCNASGGQKNGRRYKGTNERMIGVILHKANTRLYE